MAQREFPSGRFPTHAWRGGRETLFYNSRIDLEYIRRFGRWTSALCDLSSIRGEDPRHLPVRLMRCDGLASKLKVRTGNPKGTMFDKQEETTASTGDMEEKVRGGGKPPPPSFGQRAGINGGAKPDTVQKAARKSRRWAPSEPDPKVVIGDAALVLLRKARQM